MSATGYAPPAIPSVETGTPPREWSKSILASNPAGSDAPAATSENQGLKETTTRYQPPIGETVVPQTAKQYVPEQVGKVVVNYSTQTTAAEASHLSDPRGVKNTLSPHLPSEGQERGPHVSLPSTELKGAQPSEHTGGVGALPGNLSESSVALLPEERQERAQESRQRRDTVRPPVTSSGVETEPRHVAKGEAKAEAALSRDEPTVSQPSDAFPTETIATRAPETVESSIPASSVPEVELQKEVSEKKGQKISGKQDSDAVAAAGAQEAVPHGTEASSEKGQEDGEGSKLSYGEEKSRVQEESEGQGSGAKKAEGGYGGDYHPALLHPPPPGASVAEYQSSLGAPQEETHDDSPAAKKRASVSAEKKPGFMTMVKGEMKILAGKMRGDEHKVEEGKKLIHGEM